MQLNIQNVKTDSLIPNQLRTKEAFAILVSHLVLIMLKLGWIDSLKTSAKNGHNATGAWTSSIIYSLVITAKANGVDQWRYLVDVLVSL